MLTFAIKRKEKCCENDFCLNDEKDEKKECYNISYRKYFIAFYAFQTKFFKQITNSSTHLQS